MSDGERKLDPTCELFRMGDPEFRSISPLSRCYMTIGAMAVGLTTVVFANHIAKRPVWSGIHRHAIGVLLGFGFGEWAHNLTVKAQVEKDYQYYHYMTLHPEDFPPPRRIQFRDYLEPWCPIRS